MASFESFRLGIHNIPDVYAQILSNPLPKDFCVEICGSSQENGTDADQAATLARGIVALGGTVLVSGPPSGPSLARRAATAAQSSRKTRITSSHAVVIETNEGTRQACDNGFAVHLSCPSHGGRQFLCTELCRHGATVLFPGGLDTVGCFFDRMIAKRTRMLPEAHRIILVGKQGHQIALLVHHAVENGMMDKRELDWFEVVSSGKEALKRLRCGARVSPNALLPKRASPGCTDTDPATAFVAGYCRELQVLAQELEPYAHSIGVLGSGSANLPQYFLALSEVQLSNVLEQDPMAVKHGGYNGYMWVAAKVGHKKTTSLAIRAKVEGRVQATNSDYTVLVVLDSIDLRQVGLLGPDNRANFYYPGGGGTLQELLHRSNKTRYLVNLRNYWGRFTRFLDSMVNDGLISQDERNMFCLVDYPLAAFTS